MQSVHRLLGTVIQKTFPEICTLFWLFWELIIILNSIRSFFKCWVVVLFIHGGHLWDSLVAIHSCYKVQLEWCVKFQFSIEAARATYSTVPRESGGGDGGWWGVGGGGTHPPYSSVVTLDTIVWQIQNGLMWIRIPLFIWMRIRIWILFS